MIGKIIFIQNVIWVLFIWPNIWVVSPSQFPLEDVFVLSLLVSSNRNAKRFSGRTLSSFGSLHWTNSEVKRCLEKGSEEVESYSLIRHYYIRFMWTATECSIICMWIVWLSSSPTIISTRYISMFWSNSTDFRSFNFGRKTSFQSSYRCCCYLRNG